MIKYLIYVYNNPIRDLFVYIVPVMVDSCEVTLTVTINCNGLYISI